MAASATFEAIRASPYGFILTQEWEAREQRLCEFFDATWFLIVCRIKGWPMTYTENVFVFFFKKNSCPILEKKGWQGCTFDRSTEGFFWLLGSTCPKVFVEIDLSCLVWGYPPPTNSEIIICSFLWRAAYKPSLSTGIGPGIPPMFSPFKKWVLTLYEYKCGHVHIAPENMMYALLYIYITWGWIYLFTKSMHIKITRICRSGVGFRHPEPKVRFQWDVQGPLKDMGPIEKVSFPYHSLIP